MEVALAVLLVSVAGLGFIQLNRPLPAADTLLTSAVPEGAVVLDARGSLAYRAGHLPGALQLWSQDLLSYEGEATGALAKPEALADKLRALGLTADSHVVVYDDGDAQDAPAVLLVLHAFGLDAELLQGGLEAWTARGDEPVSDVPSQPAPSQADFKFDDKLIVNAGETKLHLEENAIAPLDVRDQAAYLTEHIENAVNITAENLLPNGLLPRWSVLNNQLQRARFTPDTHPLIYGEEVAQAARAWLALKAYGVKHIHIYRAPYQGLVNAGLPVSETEALRATSTPSSSVCWR